jgi:hypothetical protein
MFWIRSKRIKTLSRKRYFRVQAAGDTRAEVGAAVRTLSILGHYGPPQQRSVFLRRGGDIA